MVQYNSMQGTCGFCGAENVEVKEKKSVDGQIKSACDQCA